MSPTDQVHAEKMRLRNRQRELSKSLTEIELLEASRLVALRLEQHEVFCASKRILFYAAIQWELRLESLMLAAFAAGKTVALPRFDSTNQSYQGAVIQCPSELTQARFGILEPPLHAPFLPLNQLDLVLVPGVAFDCGGGRLGRGKGFYDRLLASVTAVKCGVALDQQLESELPREPHDLIMDYIVTPSRWINVRESAGRK